MEYSYLLFGLCIYTRSAATDKRPVVYTLQAGSSEWFGGAVSTLNCCQDVFKENVFMVEISLYLTV